MDEKEEKPGKQPYEKPTLKRFALRPEEAVLGFCKSPTVNGPGTIGSFCSPVTCQTSGS